LAAFTVSGKDVMGRLWIYASRLPENEEGNAKEGMLSALLGSFDFDGTRICNQDKTQRLAIAVLQGRLQGADIEEMRLEGQRPTAGEASRDFFSIQAHINIDDLRVLREAANRFCDDRPLIPRQEFMDQINEYARHQEME